MESQNQKLSYDEFRKRLWAHDKKFIWEKNDVVRKMYEDNHPLSFSAASSGALNMDSLNIPMQNVEDSILLELRAIRVETSKVKWAVRGVGFLIIVFILFGIIR